MKKELEEIKLEILRLQKLISELEYRLYVEEKMEKIEDWNLETTPVAGFVPPEYSTERKENHYI